MTSKASISIKIDRTKAGGDALVFDCAVRYVLRTVGRDFPGADVRATDRGETVGTDASGSDVTLAVRASVDRAWGDLRRMGWRDENG